MLKGSLPLITAWVLCSWFWLFVAKAGVDELDAAVQVFVSPLTETATLKLACF